MRIYAGIAIASISLVFASAAFADQEPQPAKETYSLGRANYTNHIGSVVESSNNITAIPEFKQSYSLGIAHYPQNVINEHNTANSDTAPTISHAVGIWESAGLGR